MNNDLISRSALDKMHQEECCGECGCCTYQTGDFGCRLITEAPAVDAVEVVRCKDCENFGSSPFGYSPTLGWCKLAGSHRRMDYYCASGRKKECG